MSRWRVGTKLGRTLYRDDVCVGMVDTPEIAATIVVAMNREDERAQAAEPADMKAVAKSLACALVGACERCGGSRVVETSGLNDDPIVFVACPDCAGKEGGR